MVRFLHFITRYQKHSETLSYQVFQFFGGGRVQLRQDWVRYNMDTGGDRH